MLDFNLLSRSFVSLISLALIELLGLIAKKPIAVREIARTRRKR